MSHCKKPRKSHPRFLATLVLSPPSLIHLYALGSVNRLGVATPATPTPNKPTTSQSTPQKTAPPSQEEVVPETGGEDSSAANTPVKTDEEPQTKKRKKGQQATRSSPRKQLAKRSTGAPVKSTLQKIEEKLAAGEKIDVDISADSDNLDLNEVNEEVSDDEVS